MNMNPRTMLLPVVLMIVALAHSTPALTANAWLSVPSTADSAGKVIITGGNLPPFTIVTLKIENSSGFAAEQAESTTAEGHVRAEFQAPLSGTYSLKAFDQNGAIIGNSNFIVQK
jgi:hypothetical protein